MNVTACKPLADHLDQRRASGLVDIKFYVRDRSSATVALATAEVCAIFDAIKDGAVESFDFADKRPMIADAQG